MGGSNSKGYTTLTEKCSDIYDDTVAKPVGIAIWSLSAVLYFFLTMGFKSDGKDNLMIGILVLCTLLSIGMVIWSILADHTEEKICDIDQTKASLKKSSAIGLYTSIFFAVCALVPLALVKILNTD